MSPIKCALVTGGTRGIGAQIVDDLANAGFLVYFTGRNKDYGDQRAASLGGRGIFLQADFSIQAGVRDLASRFLAQSSTLDILVNNVGGVFPAASFNADGIEQTMAINLVHPYLLAACLMPALAKATGRIIQLSTGYHHLVRVTERDLAMSRFDCGMNVYGRAKLIAVRAGQSFGAPWAQRGVGLHFADPGMALTPLTQSMTAQMFPWYGRFLVPAIRAVQRHNRLDWCSSSTVYLATRSTLPRPFGVYVLPGPRVLPTILVGYAKHQASRLRNFTRSLLRPENRAVFDASLTN